MNNKTLNIGLGLLAVVLPWVITDKYLCHVLVIAGVFIILSLSLNLIMGYVGQFPLGQQIFFGVGAYTAAIVSTNFDVGFFPSMLAAAFLASLVGLVIGFPTLKLKGPYFVIASLAFNEIAFLIAWNWMDLTGGPDGIIAIPYPTILGVVFKGRIALFYIMAFLVALTIWINRRLLVTRTGRAYMAVRDNEDLAQSVGINAYWCKLQAFVVSAFLGGVAGGFYAHFERLVSPTVFGFDYLTGMLVMVYVGGKGTIGGPLVGAIIFTFLLEYLQAFGMWRWVIFGSILLLAVLVMPEGLAGLARSWWASWRPRVKANVEGE